MTTATELVPHLSVDDRHERGKQARDRAGLDDHAGWHASADRRDPVELLEEQNKTRDPDLVPVRHGRMMVSAFTFYRGSAGIMAADLASTPTAGLDVQLCGDAHLSNFGAYASPERQLLFDLNDFDETLPGPFEYDVKRLAASFTIAARNNGFTASEGRDVTRAVVEAYRTAMAGFATSDTLDVWYAKLSEDELVRGMDQARQQAAKLGRAARKRRSTAQAKDISVAISRGKAALKKAHGRTNLQALSKLTEVVDGRARIASQPPVLIPFRELAAYYGLNPDEADTVVTTLFDRYRATLSPARRVLLDRFRVVDVARKVVGVGSVGTRSFVVLLEGRDEHDALFLQVKEATRSVLESHLPPSQFTNCGERVVRGQQLIQAASDIFLGWSEGMEADRFYYWRQLRDMKGSADVDAMVPTGMTFYARTCGWVLARAHARSGDAVAIAGYLGGKGRFDKAVVRFADDYSAQNEKDYQAFRDAISSGRIDATPNV